MDDWNDFGAVHPSGPRAGPAQSRLPYLSSSSDSSRSNSSIVLDDTSSSNSDNRPPSNPPSAHDVTSDRGSFFSSLPFLSVRRRPDNQRQQTSEQTTQQHNRNIADHGLVPLERTAHADRTADDSPDALSTGSESEAREPKSLYMPSRRIVNSDGESADFEPPQHIPKKGDLDDVPLDYEFNIEGFRITAKTPLKTPSSDGDAQSSVISSSVLRLEKTYTKLEVISSKEIKSLVTFFNIFVVLAILYTLTLIIVGHTIYSTQQDIPLRAELLSREQQNSLSGPIFIPEEALESLPNIAARMTKNEHSLRSLWSPALTQLMEDELKCQGLYRYPNGLYRGERRPELCRLEHMRTSSRQTDGAPTEEVPSAGDGASPAGEGAPPGEESPPSEGTPGEGPPPPLPGADGPQIALYEYPVELVVLSRDFKKTSHFVNFFLSIFLYFAGVLYTVRIFRAGKRNVTHEQVWVLVLIFTAALYLNAFEAILRLVREFNFNPGGQPFADGVHRVDDFLTVLRDVAFTVVTFFYLWASFHSYRFLDPTQSLGFRSFYLSKLIVLLPYCAFVPISFYAVDMRISDVPLLSAPAFAFYYGDFQIWSYLRTEAGLAIGKTIYELLLTIIIIVEAYRTMRVLENASYMKYRTKRVGFRFFLYINFVFYVLFIALQCVLLFGKPKGENILQLNPAFDFPMGDILWYWALGPSILLFGYVVCTAYVHLPCTSVGPIKGWFKSSVLAASGSRWSFSNSADSKSDTESPSVMGTEMEQKMKVGTWTNDEDTNVTFSEKEAELKNPIVEPYTYRMGESKDSLQLKANCFTMQTHVIMFNFAWYVYYYNTPKLENFRPKENPLPFAFKIAAAIKSEVTDTQVLVVDCTDRIIITFRGTTSFKNLQTSLRMSHSMLSSVVRTSVTGEDESARLKRLFGTRYTRGKIHKGFAHAYTSVADEVMQQVRVLRERKKRAVFLTGHSLGGALATLCSLDLWVKLDISRREIFVSTFGSPRVGNVDFAAVYAEVVPLHWRIVVHPDMVAKLPRVGYTHVGKKVVLTPHGEMLIDPNALEQRPWTGEAAGFAYHRKASYMLAMRAWCVRNHEMTYTPVFWPFPVRPDDERRFAGAFGDDEAASGRKMAAKIIRMDAMVDALGRTDTELANMAVVEKWARLTRRVLLNHTLTSTRTSP